MPSDSTANGYLNLVDGTSHCQVPLNVRSGHPLGAATLEPPAVRTWSGYGGRLLPGALRSLGAAQLCHRIPSFVAPGELRDIEARLRSTIGGSVTADPCWVVVPGCCFMSTGEVGASLYLTRQQLNSVGGWTGSGTIVLPTTQQVTAVCRGGQWWSDPPDVDWYGDQELIFEGDPGARPGTLQLARSSLYPARSGSENTYVCLLNDRHEPHYGKGVVLIVNRDLESRYPGLQARFPVYPLYDRHVPANRMSLDDTMALAVGLRDGEFCDVHRLAARPARRDRVLFGFRHQVCRVIPSTTVDQERPIARLPAAVLDVLGIRSGGRIIVYGYPSSSDRRLPRTVVRVFEERGARVAVRTDQPDYFDEVGSVDLPYIAIDLARRKELSVVPGSAVYVRPAISSVVAEELVALLVVLGAAFIGAAGSRNLTLSIVIAAVFIVVVAVRAVRKFR